MIITTKKYQLPVSVYVKKGVYNMMRKRWWMFPLFLLCSGILFYFTYKKWAITFLVMLGIYWGGWALQFYGVSLVDQNKALFGPISYKISSKEIVLHITPKQGMPIDWKKIKYVRKDKRSVTLFLDKAQFFCFPYKVFRTPQDLRFFQMLLKRKKLID